MTDDVSRYRYDLPDELVAAHPVSARSASRLMVLERSERSIAHRRFEELGEFLGSADLLVFNDTKVVPARIHAEKAETGGKVELLVIDVLEPAEDGRWTAPAAGELVLECMTRSSRPLRPGMEVVAGDVTFETLAWEKGIAKVRADHRRSAAELLEALGEMPLPPYILRRREELGESAKASEDRTRYQTVYAEQPGAVAAPTAGLHFTPQLLDELRTGGVETASVTLHVGPGTFRPVTAEKLSDHDMHTEPYVVGPGLGGAIERTRSHGGRVVAVGTTTVRTLEAEARRDRPFEPGSRTTDIFIKPGFAFRAVDAMITNFHLPQSTLLALVAAFADLEFVLEAYETAIEERYRFYSYGDAMLIA